jgi:DNA modification methylase
LALKVLAIFKNLTSDVIKCQKLHMLSPNKSSTQEVFLTGDALKVLSQIGDGLMNTCVTSPPYFGLRNYNSSGQIGLEKTPDEYIAKLLSVFKEVHRVLRDDGTFWLNLGDSYARSDKKGGSGFGGKNQKYLGDNYERARSNVPPGLKQKDLIGIPWLVAFALRDAGWYLRQDIIWSKPNPMTESVLDRCTKSHEYIFLLSKSEKYFYDGAAIAEPVAASSVARLSQKTLTSQKGSSRVPGKTNGPMKAVGNKKTRNKRSVWSVTTKPFKAAHFATFPPDLIEPCVLAGCPEGGWVLDPFAGAGTTALVSKQHGRNSVSIELNPEYVKIAQDRLKCTPSP